MMPSKNHASSQRKKRHRDEGLQEEISNCMEVSQRRPRFSNDEEDEEEIAHNSENVSGKVKKIRLCNFMCHSLLEFNFSGRINFVSGKNGSGKSAVLTALVVGLGGRSSSTNRGNSVKSLIKNGENSCVIEITLCNDGVIPYNKEMYGNEITVIRKISEKCSSYKLLSEKGKVISTKKQELAFILQSLNIQINNPICILNQDTARSFLKSTSPLEFYRLFRKGTLLEYVTDKIIKFGEERMSVCKSVLEKHQKEHKENSKDLLELQRKKKEIDKLHKQEEELKNVVNELHWSHVTLLEEDIEKEEKILNEYQQSLIKLQERIGKRDSVVTELQNNIKLLDGHMKSYQKERQEIENASLKIEHDFMQSKQMITKKMSEIKRIEEKKNSALKNRDNVQNIINNQESQRKEREKKLYEKKRRKDELNKKCEDIKAALPTAEVHKQQLTDTVNEHKKNAQHKQKFLDNLNNTIRYKEQYLRNMRKESNALSVYGTGITELVEAIKNIGSKGEFEQLPRGPLGSYIKLVEEDWGPAIEYILGSKALQSFCVHSKRDFEVLNRIMDRLNLPNSQRPTVSISKFFHKIHDVSRNETKTLKYSNLFRMLVISDPVVANTVIDQWQVERVLLVPKNEEAYPLVENVNNVPRNCQRVLTKTGDTLYPQPNYKTYAGSVNEQARFLQVNPQYIIKLTEIELAKTKKDLEQKQVEIKQIDTNLKVAIKGLHDAEREVLKLTKQLATYEMEIVKVDNEDVPEDFNINILSADLKHWTNVLESCESSLKEIEEYKSTLIENAKELKIEINEFEIQKNDVNNKLKETEEELSKVKSEFHKVNKNHDHYKTLLINEETKREDHTKKLQKLHGDCTKAKEDAAKVCPDRFNNPRPLDELSNRKKTLEREIGALKKILGEEKIIEPEDYEFRIQELHKKLDSLKIEKEIVDSIQNTVDKLPEIMDKISFEVGCTTDSIFQNVLKERHFIGKLDIDHKNKKLNIIIKPDPKAPVESPISTLSGGERSFSMVAFIVALWENMKSPFYFLDEFDVFMDDLNRKIVMDLLISIGKSRPQHQYVFLTPHSTIAEEKSNTINFFRLKKGVDEETEK